MKIKVSKIRKLVREELKKNILNEAIGTKAKLNTRNMEKVLKKVSFTLGMAFTYDRKKGYLVKGKGFKNLNNIKSVFADIGDELSGTAKKERSNVDLFDVTLPAVRWFGGQPPAAYDNRKKQTPKLFEKDAGLTSSLLSVADFFDRSTVSTNPDQSDVKEMGRFIASIADRLSKLEVRAKSYFTTSTVKDPVRIASSRPDIDDNDTKVENNLPDPTLEKGNYTKGNNVKLVQIALNSMGYLPDDEDDGIYGRKTRNAIMSFQGKYGLGQDGLAGRKTLIKLSGALAIKEENSLAIIIIRMSKSGITIGAKKKAVKQQSQSINVGSAGEGDSITDDEYDKSQGPVKRTTSTKDYLAQGGTKGALIDALAELVNNGTIKSKKGGIWALSTLDDNADVGGKRISELHATTRDVIEGRGVKLKSHYDRLIKGYRDIINSRTNEKNKKEMTAELKKQMQSSIDKFKQSYDV